jgi:hypothetical protein
VRDKFILIGLLAAWFAVIPDPSVALGDGGIVRFSERRDDRVITVFTSPTPLRAGPVDVSVLVQDAESGKALPDVPIVVHVHPVNHGEATITVPASSKAAANKLMHAADVELGEPGLWHVDVIVQNLGPGLPIGFDMEVAEAPPPWLDLSIWVGWPLVAIAWFVLHQWLVHRRRPTM